MLKFTTLIITHGREELLLKCLDSMQMAPEDWQLILIANGKELSERITSKAHSICHDTTILNLAEKVPASVARNRALEVIKNEWVFLVDEEAYLPEGYFQKALNCLGQHQFDVLGGPDLPASGMGALATSYALTLASPFCTGLTHTRHQSTRGKIRKANEEQLSSTNLWIKKQLLTETKFPETFTRGEETMLLVEYQKQGRSIFFNPQLFVYLQRENKFQDLIKPTFNSGFYRSKIMRNQKGLVSPLYWLPTLFVLLHLTFLWNPFAFLEMAKIYLVLIAAISLLIAQRAKKFGLFFNIFILHYAIVFLYGLGFLGERMGFPWKSSRL